MGILQILFRSIWRRKTKEAFFSYLLSSVTLGSAGEDTVRISTQLHVESTRELCCTKGRTVLLAIFPGEEFCVMLQFSRNCCHVREDAK